MWFLDNFVEIILVFEFKGVVGFCGKEEVDYKEIFVECVKVVEFFNFLV